MFNAVQIKSVTVPENYGLNLLCNKHGIIMLGDDEFDYCDVTTSLGSIYLFSHDLGLGYIGNHEDMWKRSHRWTQKMIAQRKYSDGLMPRAYQGA